MCEKILPYPTYFLHVRNPNFLLVTTLTIPQGIIGIKDSMFKLMTWWHTSLTEVVIANERRYADITLLSSISAWAFMLI